MGYFIIWVPAGSSWRKPVYWSEKKFEVESLVNFLKNKFPQCKFLVEAG